MQNFNEKLTVEDFENKSLKMLKNIAKLHCVKGYSTLRKEELKKLLIKELVKPVEDKSITVGDMINILEKMPKDAPICIGCHYYYYDFHKSLKIDKDDIINNNGVIEICVDPEEFDEEIDYDADSD